MDYETRVGMGYDAHQFASEGAGRPLMLAGVAVPHAQGLAGPEQAKFVVSDGASAPVITDGPFPESKELLAGYRIVDVDSAERAIDIAARISAAPGANGAPVRVAIEVREVMSAPDPEV